MSAARPLGRCALPALALALAVVAPLPAAALSLPPWLRFFTEAADAGPPRPVVTEILEDRGEAARWIPGVVASRTQVSMAFQSLGRMITREADLGDRVAQGDVLAELATEDLEDTTRAARAAAEAAGVQLRTALATLERTTALTSRNVASAAQLEQAQRAAAAAEAAEAQARSELVRAEDAQGFARIVAPFAGVISAVYEAPGAVVGAGAPILQLSADDRREAVIDLPETALAGLPRDAVFTVWQRTAAEAAVPARLDRIEPLADAATRTRRLYLSLPADAPFRLGALVRARLGAPGEPVLTVPAEALFQREGNPHVWCVIRKGDQAHVKATAVTRGADFRDRVVVTAGLSEGNEIVIRGVRSLVEGQPVGRRVDP